MSIFHNNILGGAASASGGAFTIERSLRFTLNHSAQLSRTYGNGNNRKFTVSAWIKRTPSNSSEMPIIGCRENSNNRDWFGFESDELVAHHRVNGTVKSAKVTDRKFRDFSAWYHIVYAFNSTLSTQNDRTKFYVNGVRQTVSTYNGAVGLNDNVTMNKNNIVHYVGVQNLYQGGWADCYMADVHFIDNQEKDADDFGEYDDNNVWQPKKYDGTYGTTGWHLDFADNSSTTALGYDAAGSNNWTPTNFSVSSNKTNDSVIDTPTDNYAIMNILTKSGNTTIRDGGLHVSNYYGAQATIGMPEGKYYFEFEIGTKNDEHSRVGINRIDAPFNVDTNRVDINTSGQVKIANVTQTTLSSLSTGDVVGIAFNADTRACSFYINGTLGTTVTAPAISGVYAPHCGFGTSNVDVYFNAGQQPFQETEPTGFDKRVRTADLPDPTIEDPSTVFDAVAYSGTGSTLSVTGLNFSPDLVWTKERNTNYNHGLYDTVRGATKGLTSNDRDQEYTQSGSLTSFDSNGFTLGTWAGENDNSTTYIAWAWDAGSSTASNTNGSITSSVRANASAGFSIVSWTGNTNNSTIGHGLGAVPELIILKDVDSNRDWYVGSSYISGSPWLKYMNLNSTNGANSNSDVFQQGGQPTSSVFGVGAVGNPSGSNIAYCFTSTEDTCKVGKYTGTGTTGDGPFVYCGFTPRFLMVKNMSSSTHWFMWDTARIPYNVNQKPMRADSNGTELNHAEYAIDFLSNGFKVRANSNSNVNTNADYLFLAFAQEPFKVARAR